MAQLRDTVVSGSLRATDSLLSTTASFQILNAPTTSNGSTYGPGTAGNVLSSNGTSIYWRGVTDNSSATAVTSTDTNLITGRTLYNAGYVKSSGVTSITIKTSAPLSGGSNTATTGTGTYILSLGTVGITNGGTNITTYTIGDILYSNAANTLAKLGGNTTTTRKFLRSVATTAGTATAPTWDTVTKTDVGLSNVENTKLSTWAGSANLTTFKGLTLSGSAAASYTAAFAGTTDATAKNTAAVTLAGGLGVAKTVIANDLYINTEHVLSARGRTLYSTEAELINGIASVASTLKYAGDCKFFSFFLNAGSSVNSNIKGMYFSGWVFLRNRGDETQSILPMAIYLGFPTDEYFLGQSRYAQIIQIIITLNYNFTAYSYDINYLSPKTQSITAVAANWNNNIQQITVNGMKPYLRIMVGLASSATKEQYEACANASIICTNQAFDSITLTCYNGPPTIDIPMILTILG